MKLISIPENPYILLTPGPLSTTAGVKMTMLKDWRTWDDEYNRIVQEIRNKLVQMATHSDGFTSVLMQGSGTFCVESVLTTVIPANGILLILANGAYGIRIGKIASRIGINHVTIDFGEVNPISLGKLSRILSHDHGISHVAVVHCETTTGMLNPVEEIGKIVKNFRKEFIVDAMSSFGGIPMDVDKIGADYLISSANKCIQGVPGFGFVIARQCFLLQTRGRARSLSLDLFDQWETMEKHQGKWRFTSPAHTVRAFAQALEELEQEGGVEKRYMRYKNNHKILVDGMKSMGFETLLAAEHQSPIITSFLSPKHPYFDFNKFYFRLKKR